MSKKQPKNKVEVFVPKTFKLLASETVMSDDSTVYPMYVYIVDGKFKRQWEWMIPMTVREWKNKEGFKEVRRCDLFGHEGARLGDFVE